METANTQMLTFVENSTTLDEDPFPKPSTSTDQIDEDGIYSSCNSAS